MFQVRNSSPFQADIALLSSPLGIDTVYPILKGTFVIKDVIDVAEEQMPLVKTDEYRADPEQSSLLAVGDYHPQKPGTDVLVQGDCFLADGSDFRYCEVSVQAGTLNKKLSVFGERFWDRGQISSASAINRVPMIYELAYGGVAADGTPYEKNPIGRGFETASDITRWDGVALPCIELPDQLVQSIDSRPEPAGIGAIAPIWSERRQYAGTYDETWQSERAPFLPKDFDPRFFQCASMGLNEPHRLRGGEFICVENMHKQGRWDFDLPFVKVECSGSWNGKKVDIPLNLETLTLYPNNSLMTMTWRGAFAVNQWASRFECAEFSLKSIK